MIELNNNYGSDKKGNCDVCGLDAIGKLSGNEFCRKHMDEYRSKHL